MQPDPAPLLCLELRPEKSLKSGITPAAQMDPAPAQREAVSTQERPCLGAHTNRPPRAGRAHHFPSLPSAAGGGGRFRRNPWFRQNAAGPCTSAGLPLAHAKVRGHLRRTPAGPQAGARSNVRAPTTPGVSTTPAGGTRECVLYKFPFRLQLILPLVRPIFFSTSCTHPFPSPGGSPPDTGYTSV